VVTYLENALNQMQTYRGTFEVGKARL